MTHEDHVSRYCALLSDLRPDRLSELVELCAQDVRFKDPFNDTVGIEGYLRVLQKMFDDVEGHRFQLLDRAVGGGRVYLRWVFHARLRSSGLPLDIEGLSELMLDSQGRIASHVDYWDVGRDFYERVPLLGALVAWVRRRAAA